LRHLFRRAYNNLDDAAIEVNRDLRDFFILGLADPVVRSDTWKQRPDTYAGCLDLASNNHASLRILAQFPTGQSIKEEPKIAFMDVDKKPDAKKGDGPMCHFCGKYGHIRRNCIKWQEAAAYWNPTDGSKKAQPEGGYRGRGGRGRGYRGRGGRGGRGGKNYNTNAYTKDNTKNDAKDTKRRISSLKSFVNESIQAIQAMDNGHTGEVATPPDLAAITYEGAYGASGN